MRGPGLRGARGLRGAILGRLGGGSGCGPAPTAAPPPLPPAEADVESTARAAAGGGGAAARRRRGLSGPRGARVEEATAAARREEEAAEEEGGVHEAGPCLEEEAMNGDRTESDWQGLVSEVRPRRRPGGTSRAERSPAPSPRLPGGRAGRGLAGDAHPAASAGCPHAPRQVRRSSRPLRSARAPLSNTPAGASLWGGAFPPGRAGHWIGERSAGIREWEPSPTCLLSCRCFGAKRLDAQC